MLKFNALKPYLDEFSELTKQGKYKRIDYETYRMLRRVQNVKGYAGFTGFDIYSSFAEKIYPTVQIIFPSDDWIPQINLDGNNEFGKFLYDKAKEDLENQMYYSTINTDNTNGIAIGKGEIYCPDYAYGITTIGQHVIDVNKFNDKTEEKKDMNLIKGFEFGSCEKDNVKVSFYGVAVKNAAGTYVSYDKDTKSVIDVDILNFDAKYLYKMPVAIKDIAVGDTIIHNRVPMFVIAVEDNRITAIDPKAGEEKTILPTKNMFNFNFVTKIINLFDNFTKNVSADAPFGDMVPLMMLAEGNDDMLPLMLMNSPNAGFDMSNPMLLYFLTKDGNSSNLVPYLYLMGQKNN